MSDFLTALGLLFVFEGLIYGGAPEAAKRMAAEVMQLPEGVLRTVGFASMLIGVAIVWLVRG
jgi:uncharacterized protein YjeT (DUF2065 family)